MRYRRTLAVLALGLLVLALHATCGGNPSHPTGGPPPVSAGAASLQILGDTVLTNLGQSSQLTATAAFLDGRTTVVTPTWSSLDEAIVTVSGTGLLTAVGYGRTFVSASFQGVSEFVNVQALPKGTFILTGNVSEAGGAGGVDGAAVSLKGGTVSGSRSTTADEFGFYRFAGVAGPMTISATHAGYVRKETSVTVSGDLVADIELTPANPPANIAGTYRLTIAASASCSVRLTEAARSRTYTATIEQDGANLFVRLSGAEFIEVDVSNYFSGRILGRRATFHLARFRYDSYYGTFIYGVVEKLNEQYLAIDGDAETSVTGSTISGSLAGNIDVYNGNPAEGGVRTVSCADDDHRLTFSR